MKRGRQLLAFADSMSRRIGLIRVSLCEGDRNRALSRINRAVSASAVAMPHKQKRKPAHKGAIDRVAGAQNAAPLPPQGLRTPVVTSGITINMPFSTTIAAFSWFLRVLGL